VDHKTLHQRIKLKLLIPKKRKSWSIRKTNACFCSRYSGYDY
jgi:hypothetical protein